MDANKLLFLFGLVLLGASFYAYLTGTLHMRGKFTVDENPRIFKAGMLFYLISGIFCVGLGVFL